MKLFGRRVNPSVVFVAALALLFVVVAPLRAATRLGADEPTAEQKQLTDRAATAPATPRALPSPRSSREVGTSRRSTSAPDIVDPLQRLDDALTRNRRTESTAPRGTSDTRRSTGRSTDAGPRDEAPRRLVESVRDLADLLGGDAPRR